MGQTDLAVRLLAEHHMSALAVERSELQLVERITDQVVRARVDGVETILHVEPYQKVRVQMILPSFTWMAAA